MPRRNTAHFPNLSLNLKYDVELPIEHSCIESDEFSDGDSYNCDLSESDLQTPRDLIIETNFLKEDVYNYAFSSKNVCRNGLFLR